MKSLLFFVLYFLVGILIFRDYGVSWDELYQDGIGQINMQYITGMNRQLLDATNPATFVSPIYEMFLVSTAKAFGFNAEGFSIIGQKSLYYRHFVNFTTFFVGVVFFYLLCRNIWKNTYLALLGSSMLVLTPRVFADQFYNSKDTVFLAFFVMTFYALTKFLEKRSSIRLIALAVLTGIAFSIRVGALFIPVILVGSLLCDYVFLETVRKRFIKDSIQMLFYGFLSAYIIYVTYPVLWENPIKNFLYLFQFFGKFPNIIPNLYFGKVIPSNYLPWHFIPVWVSISTPPLYLALFLIGLTGLLFTMIRNTKELYKAHRDVLLVVLWFFVPLIAVIAGRSALYNSWRHMFFIYPAFLIVGIQGVVYVRKFFLRYVSKRTVALFLNSVFLVHFLYIGITMMQLHPYEHLFFNFLVGPDMKAIRKNFDTDYWGLTYRKGLEFLLSYDKSNNVVVIGDFPAVDNYLILSQKDAQRMSVCQPWFKCKDRPKYFMTNFFFSQQEPPFKELYAVHISGADILKVYELPDSIPFDGTFPYR